MKRLNKKGFTLVELLAVIIILAVVVGITIPTVMNTVNDSKNNAMEVAVEAAQTWLQEQATIYNTDTTLVDAQFPTELASNAGTTAITLSSAQIAATGLKSSDVKTVTAKVESAGKICVTIGNIPKSSSYFTTKYWSLSGDNATALNGAKNKSSNCIG